MKKLLLCTAMLCLVSCDSKTDSNETSENNPVSNELKTSATNQAYDTIIPKLRGELPPDVTGLISSATPTENRPFFDYFSWQSFIALNWPASLDDRGVPINPTSPDAFRSVNRTGEDSSLIVWNTYREGFELMPPDGSTPPSWNGNEPSYSPAGKNTDGKLVFAMSTKGGLLDEINEAFGGPLIDQKRNYVRYDVRINQIEYDQIRDNKWYDQGVLLAAIDAAAEKSKSDGISEGVQFLNNSIELKGAWRVLTDSDDISRYYAVRALVETEDGSYAEETMGLVGLHIMQKTETFPQWVWSTFEHIDNLDGTHPSFNNGTDTPSTGSLGYNCEPQVLGEDGFPAQDDPRRDPIQVSRVTEIPTTPSGFSTAELNAKYKSLLAGTVWENYELIGTQWPTDPDLKSPYDPEFEPKTYYTGTLAGDPFPDKLANITMETYFQTNSCMQCHYHAAAYGVDYSWIVANRVLKDYTNEPSKTPGPHQCQTSNSK